MARRVVSPDRRAATRSVRLDITEPARVAELAGQLGDVTLLINNAGTSANVALDGVDADAWEVLADEWSAQVKASLAGDPRDFYASIADRF